jgi:tetratricopeptide (TPR) repeat protein
MRRPARTGRLSVCMIVKNEAAILERCLQSIQPAAAEIIIVDTGSTDETRTIGGRFGTVVESDWQDDFSYSRNISIRNAHCPWILWLDADDVVPASSHDTLLTLAATPPDRVYAFRVRNQKPGNTGSEFMQARMFPNRTDVFFERRIHEQIMLSALRAGLTMASRPDVVIEHHGYADETAMAPKARRNIRLLMQEFSEEAPDATLAVEIADSYTIVEEDDNAAGWYRRVVSLPGCETQFPAIASQAYLGLGNIANRKASYEEAVACLNKALKLTPGRPDALFSIGVAFDMSGRFPEALEALQRVLMEENRPMLVSVDFRMARIKAFLRIERINRELRRDSETLAMAPNALSLIPDRPEILNAIGSVCFRLGKLGDALRLFEKSLAAVIEGNIDAYVGLCMVYARANRPELVARTLETMAALFAGHPRFWAFRADRGLQSEIPSGVSAAQVSAEQTIIHATFGLS